MDDEPMALPCRGEAARRPHDPGNPGVPHDVNSADNQRDGYALVRAYLQGDHEAARVVLDNCCPLCTASLAAALFAGYLQATAGRDGFALADVAGALDQMCRDTVMPPGPGGGAISGL